MVIPARFAALRSFSSSVAKRFQAPDSRHGPSLKGDQNAVGIVAGFIRKAGESYRGVDDDLVQNRRPSSIISLTLMPPLHALAQRSHALDNFLMGQPGFGFRDRFIVRPATNFMAALTRPVAFLQTMIPRTVEPLGRLSRTQLM
jgi:hypothetical protein